MYGHVQCQLTVHCRQWNYEIQVTIDRLLTLMSQLIFDGAWTNLTTGQRARATGTTRTNSLECRRTPAIDFTHVAPPAAFACQHHTQPPDSAQINYYRLNIKLCFFLGRHLSQFSHFTQLIPVANTYTLRSRACLKLIHDSDNDNVSGCS